ncbi:unnamed protein product [Phaedon cochleariae]|uniref:Inosine/uridine-preferring nucleoside hydrolase domain-containing protein n=1 Tax=Phaedon cochleariae TaxID=80249 RepID=A0A9N9SND5_PHACE|nr:unnamed protein product [Phaedon cochleariae]
MKRIIVDVDAGTDDYLALLLLLKADQEQHIKIEAITCSAGNTSLENVINNVARLLQLVRRTDIPVFKGIKHQLILFNEDIKKYHGEDGFGDMNLAPPDTSFVKEQPAALALYDMVNNNPGELTVVVLGPLTNLALAIKLYDDMASKIKEVWIMGGNITGTGNTSCTAEFNFYLDPEAAYIVLECLKCPIFILPWETCLRQPIPWEWRINVLGNSTPELDLLTRAEKKILSSDNWGAWISCDAIVAFCLLNPEKNIVKKTIHHATVELHGCLTRGQVVLDHLKNKKPNVTIIESFDGELFQEELLKLRTAL